MGPVPGPQLSQLGARGMHRAGRWSTGAAAAWALTPPPQAGEATLAQGNTIDCPRKINQSSFASTPSKRFPTAPRDFFPRVCPLLPLSLPRGAYWSSGVSHFPFLHKMPAQEKAFGRGSQAMGAGGGQPELQPALAVS